MPHEREMIEINLNAPSTPEERQMNIVANVRLGRGEKSVPFMDHDGPPPDSDDTIEARHQHVTAWAPIPPEGDGEPHLRFFSVGPSSFQIRCPLCKQRADTETVQIRGVLGELSFLLSLLSCCFPIFSLSLVYLCMQSRLKSKRLFCNKCGGYLGFYWRPT